MNHELKLSMIETQSKADEMSDKANKLDKFTALKLGQQNYFAQKVNDEVPESERELIKDAVYRTEYKP